MCLTQQYTRTIAIENIFLSRFLTDSLYLHYKCPIKLHIYGDLQKRNMSKSNDINIEADRFCA